MHSPVEDVEVYAGSFVGNDHVRVSASWYGVALLPCPVFVARGARVASVWVSSAVTPVFISSMRLGAGSGAANALLWG